MADGFWAGLLHGVLILGVGGRLAMSVIGATAGAHPNWSLGGTLQVVILGAAIGPPAGIAYAAIRQWLPGPAPARGLMFGALNATVWVAVYFFRPAGPVELQASPVLGSALFGALLLGFGIGLAVTEERLRRAPRPFPRGWRIPPLILWLVTLGSLALAAFALVGR
jgi:hypothetical protein